MADRAPGDFPIVVRIGATGYATQITAREHALRADEPVEIGGTDTGPTPYELLLAALGSCTVITMRMYAERKGWPLEDVTVGLEHARIHARDCEDCESTTGFVLRISKRIEMSGPLDETQRARLLEIADRCPVHRSLESEIRIESSGA